MKKSERVEQAASATDGGLEIVVTRWRSGAAQQEAEIVAALQAEAAPAVAAARAALPVYAEMERQHGARLRAQQAWLKAPELGRSKWLLQVEESRDRGAALLDYLTTHPGLIEQHLREVAMMTPAYAMSHRLTRTLIPALAGMADTAQQLPALLVAYDAGVAELERRLRQEEPDLSPQFGLASAGLDAPATRPRVAKSALSGDAA